MALKDYNELLIELRNNNMSYKDIADKLGYKRNTIKHYCQKNDIRGQEIDNSLETRTNAYIKKFNKMFPSFEYISGYEKFDSTIKIKCKECGYVQERNAHSKENMRCSNCIELERIERIKAEEIEKNNRVRKENEYTITTCEQCGKVFLRRGNHQKFCSDECYNKTHDIGQLIAKECIECGLEFKTYHDGTLYCSDKCRSKRARRIHKISKDKRLRKNGKPDYSISLKKLYERDKGTCYICGCKCDPEDIKITEEGYYIAGDSYPSIDHVLPIAKGGAHTWDNIKLACRHCNAVKSDNIFYEEGNGQIRII